MPTKKQNILYSIIFLIVCICWVSYGFFRRNDLIRNHKIGIGKITGYTCGGTGNAGTMFINYKYVVEGKNYKASSAYTCGKFRDFEGHFLFENFPIVYSPKSPGNSVILLTPKVYQLYNVPIPINQKWVLQYIIN